MTQSDPTDEALAATTPSPMDPVEVDGYSKSGPGPMEAIRFKWTVRRGENADYFVDETIGESLTPVVVGPMDADAAMKLVDERERNARRRFEQIRSEMIGRSGALNGARKGDEA